MNASSSTRRRRRQHSSEFKQGLVALCQPGVSISAVALANGVNANLLRRWINQYSNSLPSPLVMSPAKLVPVQVDMPPDTPANDAIEISIQKNGTCINIRWPGHQAHACTQWLGAWLA
jgi:transposase